MKTKPSLRALAAPAVLLLLALLSEPLLAFYCPSTGRFLSRDPIGEQGGANVYAFVRNDPITKMDALGQVPTDYVFPNDPRLLPQSPYSSPDIANDHNAKTTWSGKVDCRCDSDCNVSCTVTLRFRIHINMQCQGDPIGWSWHEIMHVYSISLAVKRRIVNPLKKDIPWEYSDPKSCEDRKEQLMTDYQEMLDVYRSLKNHRKNTRNIHNGGGEELTPDPGANELSPGAGDPAPEISDEQHQEWMKLINETTEIRPLRNPEKK